MQQMFMPLGKRRKPKAEDLNATFCTSRNFANALLETWERQEDLQHIQGWKVAFALEAEGAVYGLATWGRPVARLEDQETTLQLTRIVYARNAPAKVEVRFVRLCEDLIRANKPEIRRLITYRDYRAESGAVFEELGWHKIILPIETATWINRPNRKGNQRAAKVKYILILDGGEWDPLREAGIDKPGEVETW
jgi:hypothetical protein